MKHVRRRLVTRALNYAAVLVALLLLCGTLAFFVLTATAAQETTAAQENTAVSPRTISAISTVHSLPRRQNVTTHWQDDGQFGDDLLSTR